MFLRFPRGCFAEALNVSWGKPALKGTSKIEGKQNSQFTVELVYFIICLNSDQEPIILSGQLLCTCVTGFSPTNLFLERFWRERRICFQSHKLVSKATDLKLIFFAIHLNRGYYMTARGYEFYLRVLKVSLTGERYFQHEKIKFVFPNGLVMFCLFYRYWWNSYIKHNSFVYSFWKQQNSTIKVVTYRKMPVTKMLRNSDIKL